MYVRYVAVAIGCLQFNGILTGEKNKIKKVLLLLSASVRRLSVSRMRDFKKKLRWYFTDPPLNPSPYNPFPYIFLVMLVIFTKQLKTVIEDQCYGGFVYQTNLGALILRSQCLFE